MTEIPMPGDYGAPQQQPQPQSKGCCTRICECWLYLLVAAILFLILMFILFQAQIASWLNLFP